MSNKIGEYLKRLRLEKQLSIEEVAVATGIRTQYLEALEKGEYEKIPGDVFIKGFIRNYGNSLGADGNALVEEYKNSLKEATGPAEKPLDKTVMVNPVASKSEEEVQAAVDAVVTRNKQRSKPKKSFGQGIKNAIADIKTFIDDNFYETVEEDVDETESDAESKVSEPDIIAPRAIPSEPVVESEPIVTTESLAEPEVRPVKPAAKGGSSFFNLKIFAGIFAFLLLVFLGIMGYFMISGRGSAPKTTTSKVGAGIKSAHSSANDASEAKTADKKTDEKKNTDAAKIEEKKNNEKKAEKKKTEEKKADSATKGTGNGVVVEITYKEPVWTQTTADGKVLEAAIIPKGASRVYKGEKEVKVNLGAIRNVVIKVNGKLVPYGEKEWGEGTKVFRK